MDYFVGSPQPFDGFGEFLVAQRLNGFEDAINGYPERTVLVQGTHLQCSLPKARYHALNVSGIDDDVSLGELFKKLNEGEHLAASLHSWYRDGGEYINHGDRRTV